MINNDSEDKGSLFYLRDKRSFHGSFYSLTGEHQKVDARICCFLQMIESKKRVFHFHGAPYIGIGKTSQ